MIKKILSIVVAVVFAVAVAFVMWAYFFDGSEILQLTADFPEKPQGNYEGFYYKNLSEEEKIAYEIIMDEIDSFPEKIHVPELTEKQLSNVFDALHYDNADFFFLGDNCVIESTKIGTSYFVPEYTMSLKYYKQKSEELQKTRDYIVEKTRNLDDDYEKELYVHDYIIEKCDYVEKVGGTYSSSYGCLVEGVASCEGYAKAMKYILDELEIENYIAYGETESNGKYEGHAWNIVNINSDFYHLDVTWNDPLTSEVENQYAYFNVSDEEISKTHKVDKRFIGVCQKLDENYYVKNSIVFNEYNDKTKGAITSELAKQIKSGSNTMSFKVKDEKVMNDFKEELFEMNGIYTILFAASSIADKQVSQDDISYAVDSTHMIIIISDYLKK